MPLFIDGGTFATRPACVSLSWPVYCRAYPKWPAIFAATLILAAVLGETRGLAVALVLLAGLIGIIFVQHTKARFRSGALCAGRVINAHPFQVAVLTDLANDGLSSYPVLKVFSPPRPAGPTNLGTRLAAVLLYSGTTPAGHWADCHPELALAANPSVALHEELLSRLADQEWQDLAAACEEIPKPYKCGLYPLGR